ncbi:MAG: CotH kinase family protein [Verrucomicrobiota bacterium]|jgi:hypothetical protein|nr:CotH kinase family protein [Verrucomicrobiota bacterium]MDP7049818.1 CotH kinase family protein [Verrucomicrobiota bacterium]
MRRNSVILAALLAFFACSLGQAQDRVIISEFLAVNDKGLKDAYGERSDWIEIHNAGDATVDLAGWTLTDDADDLAKWAFPAIKIEAGGYLLVFASGSNRARADRELHANFKLGAGGEYLGLVQPGGRTVAHHYLMKSKQRDDISYGIPADWQLDPASKTSLIAAPVYFLRPTPGAPNGQTLAGRVAKLAFSESHGFYEQPFELMISSQTPGAVVRYTTDGSVPTAENGLVLDGSLAVSQTTVIRAAAFKPGHKPTKVVTQTYLFLKDVVRQSPDGLPAPGFHYEWGSNRVDYGMDQRVVNDARYRDKIFDGLRSIPSYSLVMNMDDLFGDEEGIYANAKEDGRAWERPCSLELIRDGDSDGFQANCGVRIRGGFSRMTSNAKHAFRFFFRSEYGPAKLKYPVFGKAAAREFDNIDLRTFSNYSWSLSHDPRCTFMRDQFNRDLQLAMGQSTARGYFCHLYINGQYWGLFNACERPEASFGESYFKGKADDFDVIKIGRGRGKGQGNTQYGLFATDGNLDAWERLWRTCKDGVGGTAAYQKLLGNDPDGTRNPDYEVLLAPDNLIDYMLVIFYGGNLDAPITSFGANRSANNWYGIRNRNGDEGFRYYIWDAEHTFLEVNQDRTGPYPAGDEYARSNPQWIWQQCLHNAEFRMRVADRVHKHFNHGGVLAPESVASLLNKRVAKLRLAVIGESARWGNPHSSNWAPPSRGGGGNRPRTLDDDWQPEVDRWLNEYIPARSRVVVDQLWKHGLIPDLEPAGLAKRGGVVDPGFELEMAAPRGELYYTLDDSDPRLIGGGISPAAQKYGRPVRITRNCMMKVRVLFRDEWSALDELPFEVK